MQRTPFVATLVAASMAAALASAVQPEPTKAHPRAYDARDQFNKTFEAKPTPALKQSVASFGAAVKVDDLAVNFDRATGAVRSLSNRVGYLTAATASSSDLVSSRGEAAVPVALDFVSRNASVLGLSDADLADHEITDRVFSKVSGATHLYLRQTVAGFPVYNGQLHVNVNREGRILSVNNAFMPNAAGAVNATSPSVSLTSAIGRALRNANISSDASLKVVDGPAGVQQVSRVEHDGVSREPIEGRLMLLPIRAGMLRLVWNFQVATLDGQHHYDFTVDAVSGKVWTRFDWTASDSYKVYQQPVESPNHTSPLPPSDGRTTISNPATATGSPFGWFDTNGAAGAEFTTTQGNNAHAYIDRDGTANVPDPGSSPDGTAALNFDFPINLTLEPTTYQPAAVTNLFYWSNIIHDIQYEYGFDEAGGNFQENNYGEGGLGSDYVQSEAQDGAGTNNANFSTPADGLNPRMQMFLWTTTVPGRDGDFDNGIIVHEYGHGISNRLVGGPSNVSCLQNSQQPGEGLSDWWSLVYTAKATDTALQGRGIGTYALGQPITGVGIRGQRYSTDPTVNTWTYESINGAAIPHGVGAVWAQAAWEVYWALVTEHGFSTNLYNGTGTAGNQRAMLYINEGLKNAICSPAFTDVRDGIIQATVDNHGGVDTCRVWTAFAGVGLGSDALSGGSGSTSPTNGFNVPVACGGTPPASITISDRSVAEGNAGTTTAAFTVSMSPSQVAAVSVNYATSDGTATSMSPSNPASIASGDAGAGTPYPSSITVPNPLGTVSKVTVKLNNLSHTWPDDLDIMLVGPGGQEVMLLSDAGGSTPISGVNLTFDDAAAGPAPTSGGIPSGTYRPTDSGTLGESLPAPAPAGPYGALLSAFNGVSPVGTWSLYVADDIGADVGTIAGGWSLTFTTDQVGDYEATSGTLTFAAGETSKVINVTVNGDTTVEPDESFTVTLSGETGNADITDATGIGTITDDDSTPAGTLSVADAAVVNETNASQNATFTVTLSAASGSNVTVNWSTALIGGATSGADYTAASGTLTFTPGQLTQTFTVTVLGDVADEGPEYFYVDLSSPSGATIADGQARCQISDDDPLPILAWGTDPVNTEGDAAQVPQAFTVTLTGPTERDVDITFATATAGLATTGVDYQAKTGSLRFLAGQTSKVFRIYILGDLADEPRESYFVNLSLPINATVGDVQARGIIVDNDPTPAGSPDLSISNAAPVLEGDVGVVNATFTVSLSAPATTAVIFSYGTGAGGTATSGVDYDGFTYRTATIAVGQTSKTFTVGVNGDDLGESDETFFVNVTSASNANIVDSQGQATITDDEP